ncbi:MAG TPA: response regulator [Steroidobacteraceae bacterium]|nr:response regulator [Steroidobacteraceae bacterium]
MTAKHALVVDDSKSARAFLTRLLEEQGMQVHEAETAEQAIEYLTQHRPEVIFMDHLMPGMDGFQAVQAIKGNPRTATIPILMYTSQEGELYLGQARALGAIGVLPKTVAPVDVRAVLRQLMLVEPEAPTVAAQPEVLNAAVAAAAAVPAEPPGPLIERRRGPAVDVLLRDELATLRRHLDEQLDATAQRLQSEMRVALREVQPPPELHAAQRTPWPWIAALAAGLVAVVLGTLWWQVDLQQQQLRTELADARATIAEMTVRMTAPATPPVAGDVSVPADAARLLVVPVPFGEAPLAGSRIEKLREYVTALIAEHARGTVEVRRYAGRFCLSGGSDGYRPAESATPYIKCDLVADAGDPALGNGTAESVAFANLLAELRRQAGDSIHIDVQEGRAENTGVAYPEIGGTPPRIPSAGEWNAAAAANNRVEIRWQPAT